MYRDEIIDETDYCLIVMCVFFGKRLATYVRCGQKDR